MRILDRSVYVGPSLYAHFPVIRLDARSGRLEAVAHRPPRRGFVDGWPRRCPVLPSTAARISEPGGFLRRMREDEGTWLGHVLEHVAIELQNMAGEEVTFGKTRSAGTPGVYTVVYEYAQRDEGIAAGELGLRLLSFAAARGDLRPPDRVPEGWSWQSARDEFIRFAQRRALGPSTACVGARGRKPRHSLAAPQRPIAGATGSRQIPTAHPGDGYQPHVAHRGGTGQRQGGDQQDPGDARPAGAEAGTGARAKSRPCAPRGASAFPS